MEFVIPMQRDGLLTATEPGQYLVEEVLSIKDVVPAINECFNDLTNEGPGFIKDRFDVLYSCLCNLSQLKRTTQVDVWNLMLKTFSSMVNYFNLLLEDNNTVDEETRVRDVNVLKMNSYILCQLIMLFEDEEMKATKNVVAVKNKGRSKPHTTQNDEWDWTVEKHRVILLMRDLCSLPLHQMWSPPVLEEEFLNLFCNACYKMLENTGINRTKELKESIFHLLGSLIKKYKNTISVAVKIVQLLQQYDHLATPLAQAMIIFYQKFEVKNVLNQIVREIGSMDTKDLTVDSVAIRSFSSFLVEIAKHLPSLILSNIAILATHLNGEPYGMRNCVLGIMGEILLQTCSPCNAEKEGSAEMDEKTRMLRDQFLDHLEAHVHDVNAFVRSRTLSIWVRIFQEKAVPIARYSAVLGIVIGRLEDKTSSVRKNAIILLTTILQGNPFAAKLSLEELNENLENEIEKLKKMNISEEGLTLGDANRNSNSNNEVIHAEHDRPNDTNVSVNILKQKMLIQYLKDSVDFAQVLNQALPLLCQLLHSTHTSDVLTTIEFFVSAVEFGMLDAMMGVRKMLNLVWSKDASVKEAVIDAYKRLYIVGGDDTTQRSSTVVKNLINLVKGSSAGQMASLEEMICQFVSAKIIVADIYKLMWKRFENRGREFPIDDSDAAIVFLGMAAGANVDIIRDNLPLLFNVGLSDRAKRNFKFARDVCNALLKLVSTNKVSVEATDPPFRMPSNHIIFQTLSDVLLNGIRRLEDEMFVPFSEQAVHVIYKLAEHPDLISERIIVRIVEVITTSENIDALQSDLLQCSPVLLARFIMLCGHVALCQMIHLDACVFSELKRRRFIEEKAEANKKNKRKQKENPKRRSLSANAALTNRDKGNRDQLDSVDDCGLTGATADDADAELIRKLCDKDLVNGDNMLACVAPLVVTIASNPGQFNNPKLQAAACLSLTKFMMVSSEFCDENMQLAVTILEKSTQSTIRSNTIVALGDLACRFPNIVEPWTPHLYARLSDDCFTVRRSALVVLTHLILHDMIKVKGQISDLALCVIDENEHLSELAKLFFQELSHKTNAIYNVLPEIITRLSDLTVGTTEEKFQSVMKYILPFVQKDRLLESLVEKLLHRFPLTRSERQWRDLAFCMPLLCLNAKCFFIVLENISCIADKLYEDSVYGHYLEVIAFAKKNITPESQAIIDELEQKIEEYHSKGVDDVAVVTTASQVIKKYGQIKKNIMEKSAKGKRIRQSRRRRQADDEDDDFCEETEKSQTRQVQTKDHPRRVNARKRISLVFSSDSDGDMAAPARKSPTGLVGGEAANGTEESSDSDY